MNVKEAFLHEIKGIYKSNHAKGVRQEVTDQMDNLVDYLLTPNITPKSIGITYATIKYWESKNYLILSLPKGEDEWRKYTIVELLWFETLKKLTDMGCNLDRAANQLLFAYSNFKAINSTVLFNEEQTPEMVVNGIRVNAFNSFLKHIILTTMAKSKAAIKLFDQGCKFYFYNTADIPNTLNQIYEDTFDSGITISISDIVFKYILGQVDKQDSIVTLFSEAEIEAMKSFKDEAISEINIKQGKGKIYEIKRITKLQNQDAHKRLSEYITDGYQDIEIKANNTKRVAVRVATKKKFK